MRRLALVLGALVVLGGCDSLPNWLGQPDAPPLPGERISVMAFETTPKADPRIADLEVRLPRPLANRNWPQFGGSPDHAMQHIAIPGDLERLWTADVGEGNSGSRRLTTPPVVFDGRVFCVDAGGVVSAFDAADGQRLWEAPSLPEQEENDAFGGGVAVAPGRVFVTTGAGDVLALDATNGHEIWRTPIGAPVRSAPTIADGHLYVVTYDNQTFALAAADGRVLWSHTGIAEVAQILGAPAPAVAQGTVVVAYSSGDLFALRADNGKVAWQDALTLGRRTGPLAELSDINASPVIDRGRVYAISRAGRLVALALRNGERIWEQEIAGVQTPWVAGDFLYVLTSDGQLLCLARRDGRIRWVRPLPRWEDAEARRGPILWSGPLLVSDRLIVVSSNGYALSISPYTGKILGEVEMPDGIRIDPVVADGTVYLLTDDAELVALR